MLASCRAMLVAYAGRATDVMSYSRCCFFAITHLYYAARWRATPRRRFSLRLLMSRHVFMCHAAAAACYARRFAATYTALRHALFFALMPLDAV